MDATEIAKRLPKARKSGPSWWACCPAHDDHNPSLKIDQLRDGTVLVKCWAGCKQDAIIAALRSLGLWGCLSDLNSCSSGTSRSTSAAPTSKSTAPSFSPNARAPSADNTARALALWHEARS